MTYSTNSSTTLSQEAQTRQGVLDALDAVRQLLHVAAELLAERKRGGILKVSTANLDDVVELFRLCVQSVTELGQSREKRAVDLGNRGNVHRSRETKLLVNARLP